MEKRIWNKSELEQMDEWGRYESHNWEREHTGDSIVKEMLGKPVQWCKDQGYTVRINMIAKTPCLTMGELTDRLDKGEIGVTLENGTTLRVGERYMLDDWLTGIFTKILAIGKVKFFCTTHDGYEITQEINQDWKPYIEPKEEPKPLEGYQKWYIHLSGKSNRVRIEYMTIEKSLELRKSTHILGVYTETEAISLGLTI